MTVDQSHGLVQETNRKRKVKAKKEIAKKEVTKEEVGKEEVAKEEAVRNIAVKNELLIKEAVKNRPHWPKKYVIMTKKTCKKNQHHIKAADL